MQKYMDRLVIVQLVHFVMERLNDFRIGDDFL